MSFFLQEQRLFEIFIQACLWGVQIFYASSFIPQIITNYKRKSSDKISAIMLFCVLNAVGCAILYAYLLALPLAFKIILPLQAILILILILQKFHYDERPNNRAWHILGFNLIGFFIAAFLSLFDRVTMGAFFGWISFALSIFTQVPQIIKFYHKKSTEGFNILFILFVLIAALLELNAAFFIHLPPQTIFGAVKGILFALVILGQVYYYKLER